MRNLIILLLVLAFGLSSCSKTDSVKLEKGTPEYEFAQKLNEKLPFMNPDENKTLITTNIINVTANKVTKTIFENYGKRGEQILSQPPARLKSYIYSIAENVTMTNILEKKADKAGMKISDKQIDSTFSLQSKNLGGEEKFLKMLEDNGMTIEKVKKDIRRGLKIQNFIQEKLGKDIIISPEELEKFYAEDKTASVRHILLLTKGKTKAEKTKIKKKMNKILKMAKKGKDFAKLAEKYTEDKGSQKNGGLYSNFPRGQMVKPFEEAAFNTPVGKISDVIETQYGYHILKVIDRKKEERPKEAVIKELKDKRIAMAYQPFMRDLKKEVEYKVVELKEDKPKEQLKNQAKPAEKKQPKKEEK